MPNEEDRGKEHPALLEVENGPRYRIVAELGRGTMGVVYEAIQVGLDRRVALKHLAAAWMGRPELLRFQREIKLLSQVTHRHVVRFYDAGMLDGCPYFSMELLRGLTVSALLAAGPMPLARASRTDERGIPVDGSFPLAPPSKRSGVHEKAKPNAAELRFLDAQKYLTFLEHTATVDPSQEVKDLMEDTINVLWSAGGLIPHGEQVTKALKRAILEMYPCCPVSREEALRAAERQVKTIFVHHFMDEHTLDVERLMKCCNHYPLPDGRLMPGCSYNLFYRHRADFNPAADDPEEVGLEASRGQGEPPQTAPPAHPCTREVVGKRRPGVLQLPCRPDKL